MPDNQNTVLRQSCILAIGITSMAVGNTFAFAAMGLWSSKTVIAGIPYPAGLLFSLAVQYVAAVILWWQYFTNRRL